MLSTLDLTAGYRTDVPIVNGVTVEFPTSGVFLVIGPNGAGKSTFLGSLYGLTRVFSGDIRLDGRTLVRDAPWRRRALGIGLVPQGRCNFPYMTVRENLRLGARLAHRGSATEMLDQLVARYPRLRERWRVMAGNLSGGEQQMLEMAMVLAGQPRVLLVDEPSLGLAPVWRTQVFAELRDLGDDMLVVVVEQNVRSALSVSDHVLVMQQGAISFQGSPDSLLADPRLQDAFLGARGRQAATDE
ncbi:ABC transporter ATP-binding protein [Actinophytocola sp.]|uniref:ABC transporter ATP-binding protein n=1 Tax=Actinophytocola sp. TaxID=1872138 RepID=UPI003D6B7B31